MTRVAIIAALPGELQPLVRGWNHERRNGVELWRHSAGGGEWIAACAGAGQNAATRAFAEVERDGSIAQAVSVGWAGALRPELAAGCAYRAGEVIDARTGERFPAASVSGESEAGGAAIALVTAAAVAGREEKLRLAATYSAGLVDMEAAAIARLAATRRIPFHCIKGVSDGVDERLPDFNRFMSASGQFQTARFVLFAIMRPAFWPALVRMGENSKRASQSIAKLLLDFLA
jgi:adenosylhomocysteine nucleosidase